MANPPLESGNRNLPRADRNPPSDGGFAPLLDRNLYDTIRIVKVYLRGSAIYDTPCF